MLYAIIDARGRLGTLFGNLHWTGRPKDMSTEWITRAVYIVYERWCRRATWGMREHMITVNAYGMI